MDNVDNVTKRQNDETTKRRLLVVALHNHSGVDAFEV